MKKKILRIDVITLFPGLFKEFLKVLPFKRAIEKEAAQINLWDLRNYALDSYGTVDDKPYGGGKGMILMIEPIYNALVDIYCDHYEIEKKDSTYINDVIDKARTDKKVLISVMAPTGKRFDQEYARSLLDLDQITLICGRYEGIDARIAEKLATKVISLGDFVLSGGETAALAVTEAVLRLLPEVLDAKAIQSESFENGTFEYPQYTRPEDFKGLKVPEVLISGNHQNIREWRKKHQKPVENIKRN